MARFLLMLVCVALVVVWLSTIQGVNSKCANHCKERCDEIHRRQRLSRLPCYIRCRKLAATCKSCSGPRWCFKCSPGYLLTTEPRCVFNKCRKNNGGCDADATCSNFLNRFGGISFTCECNNGYSGDGKSCTDVDECQTNNGGCRRNGDVSATCSNTIGSFTCSCSDGFIEKGTSCIDKNECLSNHGGCRDNGDTKAVCVNNRGSFTCKCGIGFVSAGTSCNDKDECVTNNGGCRDNGDINAVCVNNLGSFTCNCSTGFASNGTSCIDVDECSTNNGDCNIGGDVEATCSNTNGNFTCFCSERYSWNGTSCFQRPITLTAMISLNAAVTALVVHSDNLYVAVSGSTDIAVYNATSMKFKQNITVTGALPTNGMAVSANDDYLYFTSSPLRKVFIVNLPSGSTQNSWDVTDPYPQSIAINHQHNFLVASVGNIIREYTSVGGPVRSITIDNTLTDFTELSNGNLAVTQVGQKVYGVAVITNDGSVLHSYGNSTRSSTPGQIDYPWAITADSQDYLLVSDPNNKQILVLDPTLSGARTLSLPINDLSFPGRLWLDKSRGVLFVSELNAPYRVLKFSNVYSLASAFAAA